jgi:predicted Zn-dependent protease
VLLSPGAAGLFFHEVVGHRLEGTRLLSSEEGSTFRDLRGKSIAPPFVDIVDDPTVAVYQGRRTSGHFKHDDEGSLAQPAVLVERGVLRNFLTTSAPLPGQRSLNGHARNAYHERPISRMGNLFVVNRKPVSAAELKERFLAEIRRQKKRYGIHVKETMGGETGTTSYDFQAFKGEIMHAVRVFPDGREEPVRGVDFVGTPLSALDALECMGDDPSLDNAWCGAESGTLPVSTVAPSALLRNLELQTKRREQLTQYAMPLPYERPAVSRAESECAGS